MIKTKQISKTLVIEFSNEKSNSFDSEMLSTLIEILKLAKNNSEIQSVILMSGNPKLFSAGASFDEMIEIEEYEQAKDFFMNFGRVIWEMINLPKIIITLVDGKSIGGSVGLVSASDFVIATNRAEFRLSEYSIGIGPFVIAPAIEMKIGKSALMEMTIDTSYKNVEWAFRKGLVSRVFEDKESAWQSAIQLAEDLNIRNPVATAELKSIFWDLENLNFSIFEHRAEKTAKSLLTEYTKNFLKNFKKK